MAELAGRVGDGLNAPAAHPRLRELVELARDAHARAGRDPRRLVVTAYDAFDEGWLATESSAAAELAAIRADRLILRMSPPYDRRRIADGGRLLDG
jgi:alkanesulfonate monooxygenase SsuD/methylene tetrahydromethanopterin reductase-like flavin-dependent oxidoreductase (luciferase family)